MQYSIDRIYEDSLICESLETGEKIKVNMELVRGPIKEVDIIIYNGYFYEFDKNATQNRKEEMEKRLNDLIERSKEME